MAADNSQEAKFQQARNLFKLGNREEALALLYSIVAIDPHYVDAWWAIAQIAPQIRQKRQSAQRVLELDPNHEGARALLDRIQELDIPTPVMPRPAEDAAPPPGAPLPASAGYEEIPPPQAQAFVVPSPRPEPPSQPEREIVYVERERRELQPFLVINGGCTSGCFSLLLTVLTVAVLTFLLVGDSIQQALRDAGALQPNEGATVSLVAAMTITMLATFFQTVLSALPINLSGLIPAQGDLAGGAATAFNSFIDQVWSLFGYPSTIGDTILTRLSTLGPQLSQSAWIVLAVFLGFWVILAFVFVFLRARSSRLLHWALSTVGLWMIAALALGLGLLLFRVVSGPQ